MKVLSVNISEKKGTVKKPVESIELYEYGVRGDAHSGPWHRQVSLLGIESFKKFEAQAKREIAFGEFAENITTDGLILYKTRPLDRIIIGDTELEVTQIGKKCHGDACAIFREVGSCVMPKEGIFARVVKGGNIKAEDTFEYKQKVFKTLIITLSDRAFEGEYTDRSGPEIEKLLSEYLTENNIPFSCDRELIADDASELEKILIKARHDYDFIFTTGGTGIGPKDITIETLMPYLDKEIPGIMEMIRMKYGASNPNALVSRSVSGVSGNSIIFALPGSVKAVREYISEIAPLMEHLLFMLHRIDKH